MSSRIPWPRGTCVRLRQDVQQLQRLARLSGYAVPEGAEGEIDRVERFQDGDVLYRAWWHGASVLLPGSALEVVAIAVTLRWMRPSEITKEGSYVMGRTDNPGPDGLLLVDIHLSHDELIIEADCRVATLDEECRFFGPIPLITESTTNAEHR